MVQAQHAATSRSVAEKLPADSQGMRTCVPPVSSTTIGRLDPAADTSTSQKETGAESF
jgi:hypothetical protein